jgi:hypothetical protein
MLLGLLQILATNMMPFGIGTLLLVLSPIVKQYNVRLAMYSKYCGIIITVIFILWLLMNCAMLIASRR